MSIFLALIHHPVLNRLGEVSTTAVTNVDIHDLARSGRTYGVERFFVVTPIALQQELIGRVIRHWQTGGGGKRNASRSEAFARAEVAHDLATAVSRVQEITGQRPDVVVTGAQLRKDTISFRELRERLAAEDTARPGRPVLVLFGTGHGLAPEVVEQADLRLPAIDGPEGAGGYNHLPVRAAAAIVLDRLAGNSWHGVAGTEIAGIEIAGIEIAGIEIAGIEIETTR